jgi:hypothetical protein
MKVMSNSQRSISFTVGLMGAILLMMMIDPFLPELFFSSTPVLYAFTYVVLFVLLQNSYKYFFIRRMSPESSMLLGAKPILRPVYNRFYYYGILFLFALKNIKALDFSISLVLQLLVSILFIEWMLWYGGRSVEAEFNQAAIVIRGFDPRIDIPFNTPIYNHSGFYFYSDIQHYTLVGDQLELILQHDRGRLHLKTSIEMQRQLMGLFQAKGVPIKGTK